EIARFLRPETLRAKFGVSKVRNAVHCTDLPDDGELEDTSVVHIIVAAWAAIPATLS
ncbi:uncharacterized protein DEA37_0004354, partial [Paragonimus westermani]